MALVLLGPPALLWSLFGNPIDRLPGWPQLSGWLRDSSGRLTSDLLAGLGLVAAWTIWAVLVVLLVGQLVAMATRIHVPLPRLPAPLHRLIFGLAGTAALTLGATGRTDASDVSAPTTVAAASQPGQPPAPTSEQPGEGPAIIYVAETQYTYVVDRRDTLSSIAGKWLGDARRWPEICRLNLHRHFPAVGGVLRDCDLIYPGWELRLPADARPPANATPVPPRATPDNPPPTATPPRTSEEPDDGVVPAPAAPPSIPTPNSSPAGSPSATTTPSRTGEPSDEKTETPTPDANDSGVDLPGGSYIPWSLAAAIVAAAAMVRLQRRRRFTPAHDGQPQHTATLPAPVLLLQSQVARRPEQPTVQQLADRAAAAPAVPLVPPGGIGFVGAGAHSAARAALLAVLASGGPGDPDSQGEVVIDTATLTTLFGPTVTSGVGDWPRLHITDDVQAALGLVEVRLLRRARILDEHGVTDVQTVREGAPYEEALPPLLLLCEAPPAAARMRAHAAIKLGADLDIRALLLGEWPHGSTMAIEANGHTRLIDGPPVEHLGTRVAVASVAEATAILTTLHEAHTGEAATPHTDLSTSTRHAAPRDVAEPQRPAAQQQAQIDTPERVAAPVTKARLRVLGHPQVEDIRLPGRTLRGKATELAVFLACHPDGADTATITDNLLPDARLRAAAQQVHTNASNLRHVLGRAAGPIPGGYVVKRGTNARYRLDPETVDVDLWRFQKLLAQARIASPPARTSLLREACQLATLPLADGCDYDWIEPHRENTRQQAIEAHLLLAEDLLPSDPNAASNVLDQAIGIDRYNEHVYQTAMQARHALGDADGIRALLRGLTKALADLDITPSEATTELAGQLRKALQDR